MNSPDRKIRRATLSDVLNVSSLLFGLPLLGWWFWSEDQKSKNQGVPRESDLGTHFSPASKSLWALRYTDEQGAEAIRQTSTNRLDYEITPGADLSGKGGLEQGYDLKFVAQPRPSVAIVQEDRTLLRRLTNGPDHLLEAVRLVQSDPKPTILLEVHRVGSNRLQVVSFSKVQNPYQKQPAQKIAPVATLRP